jgi:hypothetical protein
LDVEELRLLAVLQKATQDALKHQDRAYKLQRDMDYEGEQGHRSQAKAFALQTMQEASAWEASATTASQAAFDLAQHYLRQGRKGDAIMWLKRIEEREGGTTRLGAAARRQLQQLGAW